MFRPTSLPSEPASPLAPHPTVSFRTPLRNALPSSNHILTRAPLPLPPPRTPLPSMCSFPVHRKDAEKRRQRCVEKKKLHDAFISRNMQNLHTLMRYSVVSTIKQVLPSCSTEVPFQRFNALMSVLIRCFLRFLRLYKLNPQAWFYLFDCMHRLPSLLSEVSRRHSVVGNVVFIISRLLMISLRGNLVLSHSHYYIEILLSPFTPLLRTFDDALASSLRMHSTLNRSIVNSSSQMALGEG
ncbi:hypothetical protein BLNAU_19947 [Blattamonas nauphoetae]|uniref:Uncharacterized protein n=1 Tax=Blattamonas nauphoetae TaxID=2049346 RepID=A0ABQ9X0D6_9EUKA|nr:hypothetical protein BLNAU_19947 [Blattamonas nauphoetae]